MKKYLKQIKLSLINRLDYRQELVVSLIIGLIIFSGLYFFWNAVYENNTDIEINGYTLNQILIYYILIRIISEIIESRAGFRLSDMIQNGTISNYLIKPFSLKLWILSEELGRMLLDLFVKTVIFLGVFSIIFELPNISLLSIAIFFLSICFSFLITFNLFFLAGCIGFLVESAGGFNYAIRRIMFFLSGGLIPLSFFPETLQRIIELLPFKYIFDLPTKILFNENTDYNLIFLGLSVQIFWVITLWWFSNFIFNYLLQKNESVGI